MKASELMIGDWVMSTFSTYPQKIESISKGCGGYHNVKTHHINDVKDINSLIPIPLTEEILKANGFERLTREIIDSKKYYFCFREDTALDDDGNQFYIIDIYTFDTWLSLRGILFVHELQRLLRTIHKADLADNFKITHN